MYGHRNGQRNETDEPETMKKSGKSEMHDKENNTQEKEEVDFQN